ncbi:sterile alpha motif domain-containing protein 1-like [Agelaius tricolor]|uniref:sterile alpha motif domain-containing protein 1-like n=1 Tax=Agelaius tricolor TaxID=9191 RepID=UPI0039F1DCEF
MARHRRSPSRAQRPPQSREAPGIRAQSSRSSAGPRRWALNRARPRQQRSGGSRAEPPNRAECRTATPARPAETPHPHILGQRQRHPRPPPPAPRPRRLSRQHVGRAAAVGRVSRHRVQRPRHVVAAPRVAIGRHSPMDAAQVEPGRRVPPRRQAPRASPQAARAAASSSSPRPLPSSASTASPSAASAAVPALRRHRRRLGPIPEPSPPSSHLRRPQKPQNSPQNPSWGEGRGAALGLRPLPGRGRGLG